jgi:tRNA1(Val) A37 N6-methylase TrmN6
MTEIPFLGGKLRLIQSETGHRAGTDAVLLAATVPDEFSGLVVDAGAASGAVGLAVAARVPTAKVRLVEIDTKEAELARLNCTANGFEERLEVIEGDLLASYQARTALHLTLSDADRVITNPPFLDEKRTRASPDRNRQRAHSMPEGGLERWIVACHAMLKSQGILTMIHRADHLSELLLAFEGRFGSLSILPIYPREGSNASRVLIEGIKDSRAPTLFMPGLVLHEADGRFTARSDALHRGLLALPFSH